MEYTYQLLSESPVSIWGAELDTTERCAAPSIASPPVMDLYRKHGAINFRGVRLGRLPAILATGVDVSPTDAPIYCAELDKAWEYGGLPKAIMAFRPQLDDQLLMSRTYRIAQASISVADLAQLQQTYPHELPGPGGQRWLTRVNDPNPARRAYEQAYGYWIPGDPFDALVAVFLYGSVDDLRNVERILGTASACGAS